MCHNNGPTITLWHDPPEIELFFVDKMSDFIIDLCAENHERQWKWDANVTKKNMKSIEKCNTIQNPQTSKTQRRHVQLPTRRVE